MKGEIIAFRKTIVKNTEELLKERLKADGKIVGCHIRFYPGVEEALQVRPHINHKGNRDEDLFTFAETTRQYITGDNDYFKFPVDLDFELDDELHIWVKNTDLINDYTLSVDLEIVYGVDGDDF